MSLPHPFTPHNVLTAIMDVINEYPEDAYAKNAKMSLGRLRQRLGYAAPEVTDSVFWHSTVNHDGFYDICKVFDESGPRSNAVFALYESVFNKYKKDGFDNRIYASER